MVQDIILALIKIIGILLLFVLVFFLYGRIYHLLVIKPKEEKRGWRTRPHGRDPICYEEKIDNEWKKIVISAELLSGKKNRVIYFETEENWVKEYPEWAQNRNEIIKKVKLDFPPNRTEYKNDKN